MSESDDQIRSTSRGAPPLVEVRPRLRREAPVEPEEKRRAKGKRAEECGDDEPWPLYASDGLPREQVAEEQHRHDEVDEERDRQGVAQHCAQRHVVCDPLQKE